MVVDQAFHFSADVFSVTFHCSIRYGVLTEARIRLPILSYLVHETATYRCNDTRGCVMQFCPPDDEHMCSKHVET